MLWPPGVSRASRFSLMHRKNVLGELTAICRKVWRGSMRPLTINSSRCLTQYGCANCRAFTTLVMGGRGPSRPWEFGAWDFEFLNCDYSEIIPLPERQPSMLNPKP